MKAKKRKMEIGCFIRVQQDNERFDADIVLQMLQGSYVPDKSRLSQK